MKQTNFLFFSQAFVDQLPGGVAAVNENSECIIANATIVQWTGFKALDNMLGKKYADMPCKAAEEADIYMEFDRQVKKNNVPIRALGYCCYFNDQWKSILYEKFILKDENSNFIGVASSGIDISNYRIIDFYRFLDTLSNNKFSKPSQQINFVLEDQYPGFGLSERETECMFLHIRGRTSKEIARTLKILPRTVETYIDQVKIKLDCQTKSQLLDKAINLGYMNIVPNRLFNSIICLQQNH